MLALILFLLAALLSLWGSGSGEAPPAAPAPPPYAAPAPAETPPPVPAEPEPPAVLPEEPEEVDGCPEGCEKQFPDCYIKGNISSTSGERIYHVPGQRNYDDTVIEPWKGERWFCTEEEAVANKWRKAKR